jgi:uncharacterized iron-regulated protein
MKPLYLFLLLVFLFSGYYNTTQAQQYKIYSTAKQQQISIADIISDMRKADVLFFGEEHDDSTGHAVEYVILKGLVQKYPGKVALSMEMFETDCQTVLNEYLKGYIREKSLISDARTWPNYTDYRPMVELAKLEGLPVIAANSPARYTHMATANGLNSLRQLDSTGLSYLPPLPIDTATGAYHKKFTDLMGGEMPGMHMYQAQNLWDATMAWSIAKFSKAHPAFKIMHINGGFHSEEKLGTVSQLKKYAPNAKSLTIAAYADSSYNNPDWSKYKKMADYIILTEDKKAAGN